MRKESEKQDDGIPAEARAQVDSVFPEHALRTRSVSALEDPPGTSPLDLQLHPESPDLGY